MEYGNSNNGQHRYRHRGGNQVGEAGNRHQKRTIMTLAKAQRGDRLWIAGYESKEGVERLVGMGLAPGMAIEVVKTVAGNLVVAVGETKICFAIAPSIPMRVSPTATTKLPATVLTISIAIPGANPIPTSRFTPSLLS